MRKITKRSAAILAATVVAVGGTSAAWAFTSWGDGTATATATAASIVPISANGVLSSNLVPGKWSNVKLTAANKNEYDVRITGATIKSVKVQGSPAGCDENTAHLVVGSVSNDKAIVPKGAKETELGTFTDFIGMTGDASAACAGAKFDVVLNLTGVAV